MKTLVTVLMLLCVTVTAFAGNAKNVDSKQAKGILAQKGNMFLVDVRTPDEYRQAHLRGAVSIPLNDLKSRLGEIPKNRPVLVYCAVGARSAPAAGFLAMKGYQEVYHLTDGLVGWYKNGFPIER
jgi:rhodanese-related sulfurtransferase